MCFGALDNKRRAIWTLKTNIDSPSRTMWRKLSVKLRAWAKQNGVIFRRRRKNTLIAAAVVPSVRGIIDGYSLSLTHIHTRNHKCIQFKIHRYFLTHSNVHTYIHSPKKKKKEFSISLLTPILAHLLEYIPSHQTCIIQHTWTHSLSHKFWSV